VLEVVHVVERDSGAVAHAGSMSRGTARSIRTRRTALAALGHELELLAADDLVRRGRGADHDVRLSSSAGRSSKRIAPPPKRWASPIAPVVAAVGPKIVSTPAVAKRLAVKLRVLARADDQDAAGARGPEHPRGELHRHRGHRDVRAAHAGIGPHALAGGQRLAESRLLTGPVTPSTSASSYARFTLALDLGLADDH
jgi:hypothetical protein